MYRPVVVHLLFMSLTWQTAGVADILSVTSRPAMMAGKQPVKQRGACPADMEVAGGRRCKTDTNRSTHKGRGRWSIGPGVGKGNSRPEIGAGSLIDTLSQLPIFQD